MEETGIAAVRRRCAALLERLSRTTTKPLTPSVKATLVRLIQSELSFLDRTSDPYPLSSNIGHMEAVVHVIQQPCVSSVSRACKPLKLSSSRKVYVDIVCCMNGRPAWVIVSDRNPIHVKWESGEKNDGLKRKIGGVIDAGRHCPVSLKPCLVVLFFASGVGGDVYEGIISQFGGFKLEMEKLSCEEVEVEDGWIDLAIGRSFFEACIIGIEVNANDDGAEKGSDRNTTTDEDISHEKCEKPLDLDSGALLCSLVSRMKCWCCNNVDINMGRGDNDLVNFDTTALVAIVSGISNGGSEKLMARPESELRERFKGNYEFMIAQVNSEIENPMHLELADALSGKRGIVCESVFAEFQELVSMCGGPNEKSRARHLLKFLKVVPDCPSTRLMSLSTTRKLALKNKVVFGTGDYWHAPTLTANMAFVRAVSQTGMSLCVIEHRPRALIDERDALIQLRDSVSSSAFNLHSNWTGPPCNDPDKSRWAGVSCSNWHVTVLVLDGIQMSGTLPPTFLQNLTFLSMISLRNNSLQGPLPNLTSLLRLEYVFLSGNRFSGPIPFDYINLQNLKQFEVQENDLSGTIPPFDQPSLIDFNVSSNLLEGEVPDTAVLRRFPLSSYGNNSGLCGDISGLNPCPIIVPPSIPNIVPAPSPNYPADRVRDGGLEIWAVALIAAAAALVPLSVITIFLCYYRRAYGSKAKQDKRDITGEASMDRRGRVSHWSENLEDSERALELEFLEKPTFDLDDLLRAAAEQLGRGKIGTTYRAVLDSGSVVAVKRLKETNISSKKEFAQQIHLLGSLNHESLTKIVSFFFSRDEKLIVYEFLHGDTLYSLLHENRGIVQRSLNWRTRLIIAKEVAKAAQFLHERLASQRLPHGDIKSSNVFINQQSRHSKIEVKLTDYGFAPLVPLHKLAVSRAPEFKEGSKKATHKSDVYCFGVLLLEIITGKVPPSPSNPSSSGGADVANRDLSGWVRTAVECDWSTDVLDVEILGEREGYDDMLKVTEIGLECTDPLPEMRPKMSQVVRRLQEINASMQI